jgi:pyrimidine-nucleoside phosphorylase
MIHAHSSDEEIVRFLDEVRRDAPADVALAADLAEALAESGENFRAGLGVTADVASTGGPSSLTTLLCPLYLRVAGCIVPKLGVPGRPAGGIDCLAQLPGYKTALSRDDLTTALEVCGYAHFLASDRYAPLDARVFRLRQQHGVQDVPTLVAASLLSKKLAVGVERAGLDVRVAPHGNFGCTWSDAKANAALFVQAARRHAVDAFPVLTDARHPYQPYIGRREALVALSRVFDGAGLPWLNEHVQLCCTLALACVPADMRAAVADASPRDLRRHFDANIEAQGSTRADFDRLVKETLAAHRRTLYAQANGFVDYSLEGIRRAMVKIQHSAIVADEEFPDPVGVILLRRSGEWVRGGERVATVRMEKTVAANAVENFEDSIFRTVCRPVGLTFEGVDNNG